MMKRPSKKPIISSKTHNFTILLVSSFDFVHQKCERDYSIIINQMVDGVINVQSLSLQASKQARSTTKNVLPWWLKPMKFTQNYKSHPTSTTHYSSYYRHTPLSRIPQPYHSTRAACNIDLSHNVNHHIPAMVTNTITTTHQNRTGHFHLPLNCSPPVLRLNLLTPRALNPSATKGETALTKGRGSINKANQTEYQSKCHTFPPYICSRHSIPKVQIIKHLVSKETEVTPDRMQ